MVISAILGALDIITGIILIAGLAFSVEGNSFVITLSMAMAIKGVWFILSGLAKPGGKGRASDALVGMLDLAGAGLAYLMYSGTTSSLFALLGIVLMLKGAYSFVSGMTR